MTYYIAQAVGFVGMTLAFISFQQNKRERITFLQMLSSMVWTLHFGLLGAYSGMAMNAMKQTGIDPNAFIGQFKKML